MKARALPIAMIALVLGMTCNSAHAVTWFDSNIRPDGVSDSASGSSDGASSAAPVAEDGSIFASSSSTAPTEISAEVVSADGEVYDSGD